MDAHPTHELLISMHGMGVKRGDRWLVEGVDMTIRRGEIVTLIGPNGSGKSTIAKVATGVMRHSAGTVTRAPGIRVGTVPQKLTIDPTLPLTVRRLMTLTGPQSRPDIAGALEAVGIAGLAEAAVHELSGGEFQRALLARAMVRKPEFLVLDEPVQGVDSAGEVAIYELISEIRDRTHCGVLLISHDLHVVMAQTDTVICLNGHVCCRGTPDLVANSAEYRQLFGARAAETLAVYRHHHDHTHLPGGRIRHADGTITGAHEHEEHDDA